jgi:HEAT repeats
MVMVVRQVIRRSCLLTAILIRLAQAQPPPPSTTGILLERSTRILSDAIHQAEYERLSKQVLYQYHNRTARQLVLENRLYPLTVPESMDPQMVDAALPLLEDRLRHGDSGESGWAAILISRASANQAVAVLSKCARDETEATSSTCVGHLYQMGAPAIPALRALAKSGSRPVRTAALSDLGRLQDRGSLSILLSSLADRDPGVRLSAAGGLAYLGNPGGAAFLRQSLGPEPDRNATLALAAIGDPAQTKVVLAWLQGRFLNALEEQPMFESDEWSIWGSLETALSLAEYRTPAAREIIAAALKDKGYKDRVIFAANMPRPVWQLDSESLRLGLEDNDPRIRVMAAKIADQQGDPRGLDELSRLAGEREASVHGTAIEYLARAHTPGAVAILRKVAGVKFSTDEGDVSYEDTYSEVNVISGIRKGGGVSDVPALMSLAEDQDSNVACAAIHAAAVLSPGDGVRLLAPKLDGHRRETAICAAAAIASVIERDK